jgi:NADH:ubiquinone oxidoreductase subunit 3 (subunit A)
MPPQSILQTIHAATAGQTRRQIGLPLHRTAHLPLAVATNHLYQQWGLLGLLFLIALMFGVGNVVISHLCGPARKGRVKDSSYESGVDPLGGSKKRFNVHFYLVAMIFLVFDVEVLFLIPWISVFNNARHPWLNLHASGPLFLSVILFAAILLLAYVYAWGKGVFQWD